METKYSEKALLSVCYTMGIIIFSVIVGIVFCVTKVLKQIT